MQVWVTKSGAKYHRDTCRFAKVATAIEVKDSGKRAACAVCKPHLSAAAFAATVKSVGKENLAPCKVCAVKGTHMSKDAALAAGHVVTKTGACYHDAKCKLVNRTVKTATPKPAKPIKPIGRRASSTVEASVLAALGL